MTSWQLLHNAYLDHEPYRYSAQYNSANHWYSWFGCDVFSVVCVELAQAVVDAGAVPLLILCLQEPEIALKRVAASSLSDICKHSLELAQTVVDAGAIAHLAQMILNPDSKLKVSA